MNNFEDKLKHISKQDFEIPKSYENSVNDALNYISNIKNISNEKIKSNKIKNKFVSILQKVAIAIFTGTLGVTVYAGITGNLSFQKLGLNKLSKNYEESKVEIKETIENDYFTLSLENIARDSAYIILEYKINLKEKALNEFEEITYTNTFGYNMGLSGEFKLNGEKSPFSIVHMEKESDTEYSYYQIIYTMAYDNEVIDLKIWFDYLWNGSSTYKKIQIDEIIEISSKIDNSNEQNIEKQEQKLDDGSTLILDKIINTNFQTFVRIKRVIDNISYEEYENSNFLQYKSFLITDENNNLIPYRTYTSDIIGRKYYFANTGESIDRERIYELKGEERIKVEENYVILLDDVENIENIKVIPIKSRMYNDRTNEEREMYDKATWYPLIEGDKKYYEKSALGGTLEINNIKIDEKNITFQYTKSGIVENGTGYVLIRDKNRKMNYLCSSKQDVTNSGEIVFSRDLIGAAGLEIRDGMLDNIEELEFTLLFGKVTEYDGVPFETTIPELSIQELEVDSISKIKTNTVTIEFNYGLNNDVITYIIDYDKNDNILNFNGYIDILNYRDDDGKYKTLYVKDYDKTSEFIEVIKKHLDYKNIEYTIKYN